MGSKRREYLENYIVGSALSNREYLRDCTLVIPCIANESNKELFRLMQTTTDDVPVIELVQRCIDAIEQGKPMPFSRELLVRMVSLSSLYDFDFNRRHYNHSSLVHYYMTGEYNVMDIEFSDYLNKFITTIYGTDTST